MVKFTNIRDSLRAALTSSQDKEIDDELLFHIELTMRENVEGGMTADQAQADALGRFGDLEKVREQCRREHRNGLVFWLTRLSLVAGLALWASNLTSNINVLGQMIMILGVLGNLFSYVRSSSKTRLKDAEISSISFAGKNQTNVPFSRLVIEEGAEKKQSALEFALIVSFMLLTLAFGFTALAAFFSHFLHFRF